MVFLLSDYLIFGLFFSVLIWSYFASKKEYWRQTFKKVFKNKSALISSFFVAFYIIIALLDSIHFHENITINKTKQTKGRIISLLDLITNPLRSSTEVTYSSPLAIYSFSKKNITKKDGSQVREYPRLKKAGHYLKDKKKHMADVWLHIFKGSFYGIIISIIGFLLFVFLSFKKKKQLEKNIHPNQEKEIKNFHKKGLRILAVFSFVSILALATWNLSLHYHLFGTNKAGFDVFYVALKGARTGLVIGILTTLIVTPFAIMFGVLAGYFGGWIDDVIQYIYSTLSSIPDILLIAAAVLIIDANLKTEEVIFTADKKLVFLCIILGITSWTGLSRLIRAEVLKLREIEYIQAAEAFGVKKYKIIIKHLLPNFMHIILISVVLRFSGLVLAEAVLAYVGIGVDPSMHSWGNMINQARLELARDPVVWWNLMAAFIFMLGLVLPANIFGDAVRDALDPKIKVE